jgi:type IV pilus assembly protein PilV
MTHRPFRQQRVNAAPSRGASLIEVLIAVLILAIGMLGVAALQSSALRNSQSSLERSQSVIYNYTILDSMRANAPVARALTYNMPLAPGACAIPAASATDLSVNDRRQWLQAIQRTMGTDACGGIVCDPVAAPAVTSRCVVRVRWNDARGTKGNAAQEVAVVTQI